MKLQSILYIARFFPSLALLLVVLVVTGIQGAARWRPQARQQRGPWQPQVQQQRGPWPPQVQQQRGQYGMSNYVDDFFSYLKPRRYLNREDYQEEMLERSGLIENPVIVSQSQVEINLSQSYRYAPAALALASQRLARNVNCSSISSVLHRNSLSNRENWDPQPSWLYNVTEIGDCPTKYVARNMPLGDWWEYVPNRIWEAQCRCEHSQCTRNIVGYVCVKLTRTIPVWYREKGTDGNYRYTPDLMRVGVACVCAQAPAGLAGSIDDPWLND